MDATNTTVPTAEGPAGSPARVVSLITTDKALGLIVLGSLAFLIVIRMTFKGTVI